MANLLPLRSYRRPDQPPPVYPKIVDTTVAKWAGIFAHELGTFRTSARPPLELQRQVWNDLAWITRNIPPAGPTTAQTYPAMIAALLSGRSGMRVPILTHTGGRKSDGTDPNAPELLWPALQQERQSFRMAAGARLDVRQWSPTIGWTIVLVPTGPSDAQLWPALLQALGTTYRTPGAPPLDLWRETPLSDLFGVPYPDDSELWPAILQSLSAVRTAARASLDVRQWANPVDWIVPNLPAPPTTAQLWPGILHGLGVNYRMGQRLPLEVRGVADPIFAWTQSVTDATVATWTPVFVTEAGNVRTNAAGRLEVRFGGWSGDNAWIDVVLPPKPARKIILVDGRLALQLGGMVYVFLD